MANRDNQDGPTTNAVRALYERYPYPSGFNDDAQRGVSMPSHLPAIDHYLFGGARDFSKPFRILVAGSGTGDAVVDLGRQVLRAGINAEFLAVDLSSASLGIAQDRAARIGLTNVRFEVRQLENLDPGRDGLFDYIDCCGVLHHMDDPQSGLHALAHCLAPDGGMGLMLYGELGRTGVYDAQRIVALLDDGEEIDGTRITRARDILQNLPRRNRLKTNPHFEKLAQFSDNEIADAFLHPCDRAYRVGEIRQLLEAEQLRAVSFMPAFQYDPSLMLPAGAARDQARTLPWWEQLELAELLAGTLRKHAFYAKHASSRGSDELNITPAILPNPVQPMLSQILEGLQPGADKLRLSIQADGLKNFASLNISDEQAAILRRLDGAQSLGQIHASVMPEQAWERFLEVFTGIQAPLTKMGVLFLSQNKFG